MNYRIVFFVFAFSVVTSTIGQNYPNIYFLPTHAQSTHYPQHPVRSSAVEIINAIIPSAAQAYTGFALLNSLYNYCTSSPSDIKSTNQEKSYQPPCPQPYMHSAQCAHIMSPYSPPQQHQPLQEDMRKSIKDQLQELADQHVDELAIIHDEYQQELTQCEVWERDEEQIAQRLHAIKESHQSPNFTTNNYPLNEKTLRFMSERGFDVNNYQTCFGNQLQQVLHQEVINVLEKTANIYYDKVTARQLPEMNLLIDFTDLGCTYNKSGYSTKSIVILDACWVLFDSIQAVAEGAAHGTWNTAKSLAHTIAHPIQTIHDMATTTAQIAYHIAQVAREVGGIWITSFIKPEVAASQYHEFRAKVNSVIKILNEEIQKKTPREQIKQGAELLTEFVLTGRCIGALTRYYSHVSTQAATLARKFGRTLRSDWHRIATTPEGLSLRIGGKAADFMQMATQAVEEISGSILPKIAKVPSRVHEVLNLAERIPVLQKMFDGTKVFIEGIGEMIITIDYEHIFGIDIRDVYQKARFIKQRLSGFHHDLMNRLENTGLIKLHNVKKGPAGIFLADVEINGVIFEDKTFFPKEWCQEKVIEKIIESVRKFRKKELQPNGNWRIFGITQEGIEIETIMKPSGKIITAYPKIE